MSKLNDFFKSSKRIFLIAKKPTNKEFWTMAKIIGLGMVIIGLIGFIVKLIFSLISGNI
jgi:protein transport protein SEC61 subunit gamma and related proteins